MSGMRTDPGAEARLAGLARDLARQGRTDLAWACGVVAAGVALVVVSLLFVKVSTLLAWMLRVHATGLFGLLSACWGAALADRGLLRWRRARLVQTGLLPAGEYHRAWALLLAGDEGRA